MVHDLILIGAGILVGIMNAIAGGGNLIGFPIMLSLGITPLVANATSNLAVLPGNISAAYSYRKYLKRVPRSYLLLLFPLTAGAIFGAILLRHTSFSHFNSIIPGLILFAVFLFAFQPLLYTKLQAHLKTKQKREDKKSLLIISLAIIPFAIYGGYFGAGLGFMMLAFLGFTKLHNHIHRINALKCIMMVFTALASLLVLSNSHLINWHAGIFMAIGNFGGGIIGARVAQKVSSHALRISVVAIGLSTATYLIFRSY